MQSMLKEKTQPALVRKIDSFFYCVNLNLFILWVWVTGDNHSSHIPEHRLKTVYKLQTRVQAGAVGGVRSYPAANTSNDLI